MAIFSNGGVKATKRTTPRGSGNLFLATTTTPHRSESNRSTGYPPEKTGDTISPSHVTTNINLAPMENTSGHNRPPTGKSPPTLLDQKPESMVAETLRMKGELEFTRLLRVDGRFEGELITDKGSLVVGPKGEVVGDLKNMQEVYVEGIVRGNVFANDVKIKNTGMLLGDVQCMCLTLDPTASIKGVTDTLTVNPSATARAAKYFPSATTAAGPSARKSNPSTPPPSYSSSVSAATATRAQVDDSSKPLNPVPSPPVTLKLPPVPAAAPAAGHHQGVTDTATLKERALLEANPAPPSASSSTAGAAAPAPAAVGTTPANGASAPTAAEDAVVAAGVAAASAAGGAEQTGKVPEEAAAPVPSPSS